VVNGVQDSIEFVKVAYAKLVKLITNNVHNDSFNVFLIFMINY
jgi:hypothetical protein